jgi:hypothetical protein
VALKTAVKIFRRMIDVHFAAIANRLRDVVRELGQLNDRFQPAEDSESASPTQDRPSVLNQIQDNAAIALTYRLPELINLVEREAFGGRCGLSRIIAEEFDRQHDLPARLRAAARKVVQGALGNLDLAALVCSASADGFESMLAAAAPSWTDCGGGKRLLLGVPSDCDVSEVRSSIGRFVKEPFNLVSDASGDLLVCQESQDLPVGAVAAALSDGRPDLLEVAGRLHTRVDVQWVSLERVSP